jgi:uncharacterized protein (DUF362 family)
LSGLHSALHSKNVTARKFVPVSPKIIVADSRAFHYDPPAAARNARRILVKPNLGYAAGPPITVGPPVLRAVLDGLRRVAPQAEIFLVEGVCVKTPFSEVMKTLGVARLLADLNDPRVTLLDADALETKAYPNTAPSVQRFAELHAPALLDEVDCRISVACLKRTLLNGKPLLSASIKNLYGLFPRAMYHARSPHARGQLHLPDVQRIISDAYFTVGVKFDSAVIDARQKFVSRDWRPDRGAAHDVGKVIVGDDLPATDRAACEIADEPISEYLELIERLRQ